MVIYMNIGSFDVSLGQIKLHKDGEIKMIKMKNKLTNSCPQSGDKWKARF